MHRHGPGILANKGIIPVHAARRIWNFWGHLSRYRVPNPVCYFELDLLRCWKTMNPPPLQPPHHRRQRQDSYQQANQQRGEPQGKRGS